MSVYTGERTIDGPVVTKDGLAFGTGAEPIYSEIGLDWGFVGGPSKQLAFALLYDHLTDSFRARCLVEAFTIHISSNLANEWELDSDDLEEIVRKLEGG